MAEARANPRVCLVGTSHIKRLRDDIASGSDPAFMVNFGVTGVPVSFVCRGGWTIPELEKAIPVVQALQPDFIILKVGTNDLCSVSTTQSITVANDLIKTANKLRTQCNTRGVLVCEITQRSLGRYLPSWAAVQDYNHKVQLANNFLKTVLDQEPGLEYWPHRGMRAQPQLQALLCPDGVHVNPAGQFKLYKSIRGAVLYAAKQCRSATVQD